MCLCRCARSLDYLIDLDPLIVHRLGQLMKHVITFYFLFVHAVHLGNASMQWLGHEEKKRLHAEEAPTICGSRGQLSTMNHFFRGSHVPPIMVCCLIILYLNVSFCSSLIVIVCGNDGPLFHLPKSFIFTCQVLLHYNIV